VGFYVQGQAAGERPPNGYRKPTCTVSLRSRPPVTFLAGEHEEARGGILILRTFLKQFSNERKCRFTPFPVN